MDGGTGGQFGGCVGAAESAGENVGDDLGCIGGALAFLFGFGGGPSFHGSLSPRPSTTDAPSGSWNDSFGVPYPGLTAGISQAAGLPGEGCEFGACGESFGPGDLEEHHMFAQQFRAWFEAHGIEDIDAFKILMLTQFHRLTSGEGIHTNVGGNWNKVWSQWIQENPNATAEQIWGQALKMLQDFGMAGKTAASDFFVIVDPCVSNPKDFSSICQMD